MIYAVNTDSINGTVIRKFGNILPTIYLSMKRNVVKVIDKNQFISVIQPYVS